MKTYKLNLDGRLITIILWLVFGSFIWLNSEIKALESQLDSFHQQDKFNSVVEWVFPFTLVDLLILQILIYSSLIGAIVITIKLIKNCVQQNL